MTVKYITQLRSEDLDRMIKVSKIRSGNGIKLDFDGDGCAISIDTEALKYMIWSYIRYGVKSSIGGGTPVQPELTELQMIPMTPV